MSSGGGTTTVQQTELPSWLQDAAQENLDRARMTADIGYVPYYGIDTAGFTPMQQSAMQNTANAASAFGLGAPTDVMAGIAQPITNNLGFSGYSSGQMFDQALANLQANRAGQYNYMNSMFIDPVTGAPSVPSMVNTAATNPQQAAEMFRSRFAPDSGTSGEGSANTGSSYDYGQMGSTMEDFLLGRAVMDPLAAAGMGFLTGGPLGALFGLGSRAAAGEMIDNRMDAIQNSIDTTWDNSQMGINTTVDSSGNIVSTSSPYTWDSPSTSDAPSWDSSGSVWDGGGWSSSDNTSSSTYSSGSGSLGVGGGNTSGGYITGGW